MNEEKLLRVEILLELGAPSWRRKSHQWTKNIEIYKDTSLEKKGTNEPIILNDHILGVVGISGEPDEVRKFTKLVRSIVLYWQKN